MASITAHNVQRFLTLAGLVFASTLLCNWTLATTSGGKGYQVNVLSARIENGSLNYTLNGNKVEDRNNNSLLMNLAKVVRLQGTDASIIVIVDMGAPFAEMGKLETALDKVGLVHRRFFVSSFASGVMNEINWNESPVPIPLR